MIKVKKVEPVDFPPEVFPLLFDGIDWASKHDTSAHCLFNGTDPTKVYGIACSCSKCSPR